MSDLKFLHNSSYLIYVTKFDMLSNDRVRTFVYSYTGDPFHAMGEIFFRTFEKIYYVNFVEDSPEKRLYWKNSGIRIIPWIDKY